MKFIFILIIFLSSLMSFAQDDLVLAKSISEKLYISMAQALPGQLNVDDELRTECLMRDLYITCVVTDFLEDVGYTHGISVKFDKYGRTIAVNSVQYFEH
jgi:hypothetical protein